MKKFLFVMLTVAMATCFSACKTEGGKAADGEKKAATEQVDAKAELPTVTVDDMKALVEKAKTEGKDWSVDQWKDALRTMVIGMKPLFEAMADFQKKTEDPEMKKKLDEDPAAAAALMGDLAKAMEDFKPMEGLMDDFSKVAEGSANGKEALNDSVWGKQLFKELGLPEDFDF